jgi:hypothetical protein
MFTNLYLEGGDLGLVLGKSNYQGSETLITNCFFSRNAIAGIKTANQNALQTVVLGGNIQLCGIGIWDRLGSVTNVIGTGFQLSSTWDIQVDNGVEDSICVSGTRTESVNFMKCSFKNVHLSCVAHTPPGSPLGTFLDASASTFLIDGCVSVSGKVRTKEYGGDVRGSQFGRDDWLEPYGVPGQTVNISKVIYGKTGVGTGPGTGPYSLRRGYYTDTTYTAD